MFDFGAFQRKIPSHDKKPHTHDLYFHEIFRHIILSEMERMGSMEYLYKQ